MDYKTYTYIYTLAGEGLHFKKITYQRYLLSILRVTSVSIKPKTNEIQNSISWMVALQYHSHFLNATIHMSA